MSGRTTVKSVASACLPIESILGNHNVTLAGLSFSEARKRLQIYGLNQPSTQPKQTVFLLLLSKCVNPLNVVLMIIALLSLSLGEMTSAVLILCMILISVSLSFSQEYRAGRAAEELNDMVRARANVVRNQLHLEVPVRELVPGDIVELAAGDMVPADVRFIACKDFFINQSALTGESLPIEKFSETMQTGNHAIADLNNIGFMGSSVVSGAATAIVIHTGNATEFGKVVQHLTMAPEQTAFDLGIKKFTWLMVWSVLIMVAVIFTINVLLKKDFMEALLFSLAVAVGLTPEMLPMLVIVNLSKGASQMARRRVIVRHLNSIQNLGAMTVLCTDKTGTLTADHIVLEKHCDILGREDESVLKLGYLNSFFQSGLRNVLDHAILDHDHLAISDYRKIDEVPFDFSRRLMSVVVQSEQHRQLIVKGASEEVLSRCSFYEIDGTLHPIADLSGPKIQNEVNSLGREGYRVIALAYKDVPLTQQVFAKSDENELVLKGYLAFLDPPKATAKKTIEELGQLGIRIKVLTGDNELVTKKICADVGLETEESMTGDDVDQLSDIQLQQCVDRITIFSRLAPLQKSRIVQALRHSNQVVGYLGDGINDAPALRAADVGISVDNAVDVAKESADMILLDKDLHVLSDGVKEGRRTFSNIIKYIKMGSSSNFGNMISMTGASLFLPFLPMTPLQILLNNLLYDLSQIGIPTDNVDPEDIRNPRRWNIAVIRKFMLVFGPVSSVFDFLTFFALLQLFHAVPDFFHTGWFLESLITQTAIIYVIRTRKIPFLESKPSRFLFLTSAAVLCIGFILACTKLGESFGFVRLPISFSVVLVGIVGSYLLLTQVIKSHFFAELA